MIDFHTHILPEMDDGSKSTEESLQMLRMEAEQGITDVILTPHFYPLENSPDVFLERRLRAWNQLLPEITPDLPRIKLGAEVQYFEGIRGVADLKELCIDGGNLLLLEMPFCPWPKRVLNDVIELNNQGTFQIVLAHIERYLFMQQKSNLAQLLEERVLFQSNVSFFTDWRTSLKARAMLDKKQIHIVGSDCHGVQNRPPQWGGLSRRMRQKIAYTSENFAAQYLDNLIEL